jgi:hypothetical protein
VLGSKIIAENWDKKQTLDQKYSLSLGEETYLVIGDWGYLLGR